MNITHILKGGAAACLSLLVTLAAQAQTQAPPDAGALQRQIEQNQTPRVPPAKRPEPTRAPEFKPGGKLAVTVKAFEFRGNRRLADPVLQAAVAPWLNRLATSGQSTTATFAIAVLLLSGVAQSLHLSPLLAAIYLVEYGRGRLAKTISMPFDNFPNV